MLALFMRTSHREREGLQIPQAKMTYGLEINMLERSGGQRRQQSFHSQAKNLGLQVAYKQEKCKQTEKTCKPSSFLGFMLDDPTISHYCHLT